MFNDIYAATAPAAAADGDDTHESDDASIMDTKFNAVSKSCSNDSNCEGAHLRKFRSSVTDDDNVTTFDFLSLKTLHHELSILVYGCTFILMKNKISGMIQLHASYSLSHNTKLTRFA